MLSQSRKRRLRCLYVTSPDRQSPAKNLQALRINVFFVVLTIFKLVVRLWLSGRLDHSGHAIHKLGSENAVGIGKEPCGNHKREDRAYYRGGGTVNKNLDPETMIISNTWLERYYQKLRIRKAPLYHPANVLGMREIKSSVHLIKNVYRRGLEEKHSQDQTERQQRSLTSTELT